MRVCVHPFLPVVIAIVYMPRCVSIVLIHDHDPTHAECVCREHTHMLHQRHNFVVRQMSGPGHLHVFIRLCGYFVYRVVVIQRDHEHMLCEPIIDPPLRVSTPEHFKDSVHPPSLVRLVVGLSLSLQLNRQTRVS